MPQALIIAASPRRNGTSDLMAQLFAEGVEEGGLRCRFLALRALRIRPCLGCGQCARPPHACPLSGDDAEALFTEIMAAKLVFWAAPVYFYGLPAHAKSCVDRAQRFWNDPPSGPARPAVAGLVAGRPRGEQLFTGATLGLRYFFPLLGRELAETRCWRGMEEPGDWQKEENGCSRAESVRQWGRQWAQRLTEDADRATP